MVWLFGRKSGKFKDKKKKNCSRALKRFLQVQLSFWTWIYFFLVQVNLCKPLSWAVWDLSELYFHLYSYGCTVVKLWTGKDWWKWENIFSIWHFLGFSFFSFFFWWKKLMEHETFNSYWWWTVSTTIKETWGKLTDLFYSVIFIFQENTCFKWYWNKKIWIPFSFFSSIWTKWPVVFYSLKNKSCLV